MFTIENLHQSERSEVGGTRAAEDPQQLARRLHRQGARARAHDKEADRRKQQAEEEVQEGKSRNRHPRHLQG